MQSPSNPQAPQLSPEDKKKLFDIVKFLSRAINQARDFGSSHPLSKVSIEQFFTILSGLLQEKGVILIFIAEKKIRYGDTILEEKNIVVDGMIDLFSAIKLSSLQFEKGFSQQDFLGLLTFLAQRPRDILAAGGIEKLVKEKNIGHLKLNPVKYELIGIDEKVVSEDAKVLEGASDEAVKELGEWLEKQKKTGEGTVAEISAEEEALGKLLALIDASLRDETSQSVFVDKLINDPLEEVHAIIEAIRMLNKVGGEKAKGIISSVVTRLDRFRNSLYDFLVEGKEDETAKQTYKSAEVLGKELTKQLKTIQVLPEFQNGIVQMQFVLNMILDETEAQKILSVFLKGEKTLKKKASFFEKIMQHQKTSADFEYFMKKLLALKGMSEEEVNRFFEQKLAILEQTEENKEAEIRQEVKPILGKLSEKQLNPDEALSKLDDIVGQLVEVKVKSTTKKLQKDNERLLAQTEMFSVAFADIAEGVLVFDDEGKVAFINQPASQLLGLQVNDKLNEQLAVLLENWQPDRALSIEQLIKENKISPDKQEEFTKIISFLKTVQRSQKGQLKIAVFKSF